MTNILSFEFEELPLVISNGIEAGLINGCAEIKYYREGDWSVDSVSIEGHQKLTQEERIAGKPRWVYVKAPFDLEILVTLRLEGEWAGKVQDAINVQLASDREDAAEMRAEMRRDHMMGL